MKTGDLVKVVKPNFEYTLNPPRGIGVVFKIDKDFYGARQAIKCYGHNRGDVIGPYSGNGIGPTSRGIRDRVLVLWVEGNMSYVESDELEVISEI
jgi:hypothetical protein